MKHFHVLCAILLFLSMTTHIAANKNDDYISAKQALEKVADSGDIKTLTLYTEAFVEAALACNKVGMASWKYNNLGYAYYKAFQVATHSEDVNDIYQGIRPGKDQELYQSELRESYKKFLYLLINSHNYLVLAEELDTKSSTVSKERRSKILNNMDILRRIYKDATGAELPGEIVAPTR